jgi:hypothetical protein
MSQSAGDDAYEIRRKACDILSRMHPENEEERGNIDSLNESYSKLSVSPSHKKGSVQPRSHKKGSAQPRSHKKGSVQPPSHKKGSVQPSSHKNGSVQPPSHNGSVQPPMSSYQNGADVHARIAHNDSGEDPYHYRNKEEDWGIMGYVVQCISDACKAAASASAIRYQDGATGSGSQRYQDNATGSGAQQARPTDMSFARGGYQTVDTDPLVDGHRPAETKGSFQQVPLPNTYRGRESS